ncbi:TetR/AcrR family transcriptional regulator [Spirosoma validum]|uniref:TetR/AcrR family transcriptional regulator n=1 Tax=Spirosoma validum TaxID=2771355 RepID=A0A927B282_9BACT|nr:TetR/AcrR family transcriptional regulator [Spirosoma validum]MBD2754250.1 TetR/AcrR family transcriptional regulator [Spirosoma validum]
MEKNKRNRAATIERIIDALEEILTERGLEGTGINAIAERAAVSKVLIYRYFGGLEGLLEHYVSMGRLIPHYTPAWLKQIQPTQPRDLASIWSGQALQLFRQFRTSRAAREVLKATVKDNDPLADAVSKAQDAELTNLVNQLAFIKGGDHQATSAIILGALSYLTIQAQINRPMIGLDLRSEDGWQRIEEAVKVIYKALNQLAIDSPTVQLSIKPASVAVSTW